MVKRTRTSALALALAGLCLAANRNAKPAAVGGPHHSPFVAALMRDWSAWDTNHDDTLSPAEIDRAVLDPAVRGEDAAVAATLKMASRSKKISCPPLTKAYFEQVDAHPVAPHGSDADAARATVDLDHTAGTAPRWDQLFAAGKHRIKAADAATPAWPTADALTHMHQGPLGDCFFVAPLGAAVNRDPTLVRRLMSTDHGPARVAFVAAASAPINVTITDAERAMGSTTGGEGDWLLTLEEAYGRYHRATRVGGGGPVDTTEGTDAICNGGTPGPVITALTGHVCRRMGLPPDAGKRKADVNRLLPELRHVIASAVQEHRLITAGVAAEPTRGKATTKPDAIDSEDPSLGIASASLPSPPNITHGHAYAVIGYDPATDVVTLWNPHGQTFHPAGTPGLANGYETEHGTFKLPLAEMYQFFAGVSFETSTPMATGREWGR